MATWCWAQMYISQAEYFWDTDPGAGNGTAVLAADGSFNSAFEQLTKTGISTPGNGLHKLCIRIKDNTGTWGAVFTNIIDVQQNPTSNIMAISQAEYFWDADPGAGNGTPVLAADGNFDSTYEQLTKTGIPLPSAGLHVFNIRIKDNTGVWGPLFKNVINVETQTSTGCWQSLSAGFSHSLAIKSDGTLWSWGSNSNGQLGDGSTIDRNVPIQIGTANNWLKIAAGYNYTLGIKTDGTLWAWGVNNSNQLGDGTKTDRYTPVQIGTTADWKIVTAGLTHALAIKTDGTLWAWGDNILGGLGIGNSSSKAIPTKVGTATNWVKIAAKNYYSLAIKTDGTLWSWGNNSSGQLGDGTTTNKLVPTQIGTSSNWKNIEIGNAHALGLKTDGTLWTWGNNSSGQLGDGTTTNKLAPTQIGVANNWLDIAAGVNSFNFAIKTDGTLWSWGNDSNGQLGNGTSGTTNITSPTQVGISSDNMSISAGYFHILVKNIDGFLKASGQNNVGQLGDGTNNQRNTFAYNTCPSNCATPTQFSTTNISSTTATINWTASTSAPNGGYMYLYSTSPIVGGLDGTSLSPTANLTNLLPNTTYYWWVASHCVTSQSNWISGGSFTTLPTTITGCWQSVSSGLNHSAGLKADGTLWTWGSNQYGQLGWGSSSSENTPKQIGTGINWQKVTTGNYHTVALKADGTLWAWGHNQYGQLGDGTTNFKNTPTQVGTATDWVNIAVGDFYVIALKSNGTLWAWGRNNFGQLGDGSTIDRNIPIQIGTANDWKIISPGSQHTFAIKIDGTLWGWGNNQFNQLGDGTNVSKSTPIQIGTATNWKNVVAASYHSLGLKSDGSLWVWGDNNDGQLGDGTTVGRSTPSQLGTATNWRSIYANYDNSSMGVKTDGTLWAWGKNESGLLGDGTIINRNVPTQVGNLSGIQSVAANVYNMFVINSNGILAGCGGNVYGQIGDGTIIQKKILIPIACPVSCYAPTQFSVANVTSSTATLSWVAANQAPNGSYQYLYSTNSVIGGIQGTASSSTANLTNLLPDTTYYWWVASTCGSSQTDWVPAGSFTTLSTNATGCWENVSLGAYYSVGLQTDGTLWSWGANGDGQLGDGTKISKNSPTQIGTGNNWLKIATGYSHTVAIKTDGTLWAWGYNSPGQLGDGTTTERTIPTQIGTATDWVSIAAGDYYTVGIKSNGTLWAWGLNARGQLGDGTTLNKNVPIQIGTANNWKAVKPGAQHTLAIKTDGTLWTWGYNGSGQLGDGTTADRNIPVQVGMDTNWKSVAGGFLHTVAVKTDGTLWAWGSNSNGQLGDGTTVSKMTPIQIGTTTDWQTANADYFSSSGGIKTDGTLWAWGQNNSGQLGDGTKVSRLVPTQIGTSTDRKIVAVNMFHRLVINTNGFLSGCGLNDRGQIGDGTTIQKTIFTPVGCPTNGTLQVVESSVKIDQLKVYPNPVQDILTVSLDQKILLVTVYNTAGQLVLTKAINDSKGTIDFSALTSGVYLVKINAVNGFVKTVKVIKL